MRKPALTHEEVASLVKRGLMRFPKGKAKLIIQRSPEENEKIMRRRAMEKIYRDKNRARRLAYDRQRRKIISRGKIEPTL